MSVEWLERVYWQLERFMVPGLKDAQDSYAESLGAYVQAHTAWLDLGCGHQVLPSWRGTTEEALVSRPKRVVGVDRVLTSLKRHVTISHLAVADIAHVPFAGETFDLVTANMVVEHLPEPERLFREVQRIMKPGGVFMFHTPNALGYSTLAARLLPEQLKAPLIRLIEGRCSDDVFSTHYRVNTSQAIERLARLVGLETESIQLVPSRAEFMRFPPLAVIELLWIRLLQRERFRALRPNIIAVLRKRQAQSSVGCLPSACRCVSL